MLFRKLTIGQPLLELHEIQIPLVVQGVVPPTIQRLKRLTFGRVKLEKASTAALIVDPFRQPSFSNWLGTPVGPFLIMVGQPILQQIKPSLPTAGFPFHSASWSFGNCSPRLARWTFLQRRRGLRRKQ